MMIALRRYMAHRPRRKGISVGRRLSTLVLVEGLISAALVVVGLASLETLASYDRYTYHFILVPIGEISRALDDVEALRDGTSPLPARKIQRRLDNLDGFVTHYRADIQLAGSTHPDAVRQLKELARRDELGLVDEERDAIDHVEQHVQALSAMLAAGTPSGAQLAEHAGSLRALLVGLLQINSQLGTIAQDASQRYGGQIARLMAAIGIGGVLSALLLGLHVRQAIAPRVKALVTKVRRFQEFGVLTPLEAPGRDEIAILNHALDVGFAAIAARDRDREHFLSVAAHELKTPISNIQGLAQAALARPEATEVRERALQGIDKQTKRMNRLVEDLFLASRARSGQLPFVPAPGVLANVVEQVVADVRSVNPTLEIEVDVANPAPLLLDTTLVSHALWTMLSYCAARVPAAGTIAVSVVLSDANAIVEMRPQGPAFSNDELQTLFAPFTKLQYEGTGQRTPLGLYLCKEVARLHGGSVRAYNNLDDHPVLELELPA
jgi:signal transduction histidine kinase